MKTRVYISGINLVLSSDEIIELRKEYIGRNKHHRSFKIRGKIFTGLTDKEVEESDMITMSKKESMDYFPEMTIKILEENFSRVDINEMEKNLKKKIYEHNRENIRKIVRWSNSPENCYQTMIIETILENDSPVFLIIPSVFVKKMSVSASVDEGVGEFELLLYQRFNVNEKVIEVYKGDKGTSSPTPKNITKNNADTKNTEANNPVSEEEVKKESKNIGLITDNKIEDDEIEICLLDVDDNYIQYLLGNTNSINVLTKKMKKKDFENELMDTNWLTPKVTLAKYLGLTESVVVSSENKIKALFDGERKITPLELNKIKNMEKNSSRFEYVRFNPTKYLLSLSPGISGLSIISSQFVFTDTLADTSKYKVKEVVLGKEEDYFIYKLYNENNRYILVGMSKKVHYERNKYQEGKTPEKESELLVIKEDELLKEKFRITFNITKNKDSNIYDNIYFYEKENIFFKLLPKSKAVYHGLDNKKFVNLASNPNVEGIYEVVFNPEGKLVTADETLGTFNFSSPSNTDTHIVFDMVPYWLWGNTANDTTLFTNRVFPVSELIRQKIKYDMMINQIETEAGINLINNIFKLNLK